MQALSRLFGPECAPTLCWIDRRSAIGSEDSKRREIGAEWAAIQLWQRKWRARELESLKPDFELHRHQSSGFGHSLRSIRRPEQIRHLHSRCLATEYHARRDGIVIGGRFARL